MMVQCKTVSNYRSPGTTSADAGQKTVNIGEKAVWIMYHADGLR